MADRGSWYTDALVVKILGLEWYFFPPFLWVFDTNLDLTGGTIFVLKSFSQLFEKELILKATLRLDLILVGTGIVS